MDTSNPTTPGMIPTVSITQHRNSSSEGRWPWPTGHAPPTNIQLNPVQMMPLHKGKLAVGFMAPPTKWTIHGTTAGPGQQLLPRRDCSKSHDNTRQKGKRKGKWDKNNQEKGKGKLQDTAEKTRQETTGQKSLNHQQSTIPPNQPREDSGPVGGRSMPVPGGYSPYHLQ